MKIKNLSFNKKKIGSLILAMGICLCSKSGLGEIISFNQETTLKDGRNAKLYYITGTNSNDYAFVSFDNAVGFIPISEINYANLLINSEYQEITQKDCIRKNEAYLYQTPCMDNTKIICKLNKDSLMNIVAKWQDWYVVINEQNQTGFIHKSFLEEEKKQMEVVKVKGNNVNIRSSKTTKKNNIIGFADKTDTFKILSYDNDWYQIDYLGQTGYISSQYVERQKVEEENMIVRKMAYLTKNAPFYSIDSKRHMTTLPKYQNLKVVKEENGYLHVIVDGVHGYVDTRYAKALSKTCVIIDLQRQTLRVFQKGNEVYRAHIISGRKSMPTEIGCFKIGHRLRDYQLTPNNFVKYWIQYNHNQGIYDASWQKKENFIKVSKEAYQNYAKGLNITYPYKYGSHGCDNMEEIDARVVYDLVHVGDNVLVIGPNNLVVDNLVSMVNTLRNEHFDFGLEKKLVKTFKTC